MIIGQSTDVPQSTAEPGPGNCRTTIAHLVGHALDEIYQVVNSATLYSSVHIHSYFDHYAI